MTSDAKIGLLLGLVFIFAIAFIINGLPDLHQNSNSELTINAVNSLNESPIGIGEHERKISREVLNPRPSPIVVEERTLDRDRVITKDQNNIRFKTDLPQKAEPAVNIKPRTTLEIPRRPLSRSKEEVNTTTNKSPKTQPSFYIVQKGDNLTTIAKKFYGSEEGNKLANVAGIFEVNRKILKSQDDIRVGDKLIIPPLQTNHYQKKNDKAFSGSIFEKVTSIGRKNEENSKKQTKTRIYTVREDDNLWKIAEKQLGNGKRFNEISNINADVLEDEDILIVGMKLKIPAQ